MGKHVSPVKENSENIDLTGNVNSLYLGNPRANTHSYKAHPVSTYYASSLAFSFHEEVPWYESYHKYQDTKNKQGIKCLW